MKKKLSLKLRISLWFTMFLVFITIVFIVLSASIYMAYYRDRIKDELVKTVEDEAHILETDKKLREEILSGEAGDTAFLKEDVRLMVYDEQGGHVAGIFLNDEFDEKGHTRSDRPGKVNVDGTDYYYYGRSVNVRHGADYYVRGVVRAEESPATMIKDNIGMLILVPLLIAVAFSGGYYLTGRLLEPIREIDKTTEEIRRNGDLSRRIEYIDNGDELSDLSGHINAMFDTLENNFEAEKQFTANASHELRTPVSVILAQCEYAEENADTKEEMEEVVAAIQKQGFRMSHLIESLLMFTRIEQGTERYPLESVDISSIVLSLCEDIGSISEKNISVIPDIQQEVRIKANKELFSLMVGNLIQNAVRYGKENGHVYVELKKEERTVTLTVKDDGIGIPEKDITHVFETFYRADGARNSKGLGLGLSLVKRISEYHNGTVTVWSKEDEGSIFKFYHNS